MTRNRIIGFFLLLTVCSCGKVFDSKSEITEYIADEDNGYRFSKEVNGVKYVLQYRPRDLIVAQEIVDKSSPSKIEVLRKTYGQYLYFTLSMSKNDKELLTGVAHDRSRFGEMVNDLAFGLDQKIFLMNRHKDTIEMIDFVYPRMYGMSSDTSVLLVFQRDKTKMDGKLKLSIGDFGLQTGEVNFALDSDAIAQEPTLDFKK